MEKLFNDSETFQKERPTQLTKEQEEKIYKKLAEEIIENGWSDDNIEFIIEDLKELSTYDSGFEMAKDLEAYSSSASYDIDTDFIYWLDNFSYEFDQQINQNVKEWVKAHKPQPLFEKRQRLEVENMLNRLQKSGTIVYVNGIDMERAVYYIDKDNNKNGGVVIPFEIVEKNCKKI